MSEIENLEALYCYLTNNKFYVYAAAVEQARATIQSLTTTNQSLMAEVETKKTEIAHAWMAHQAVGDELEILQAQLKNNGWTECAKNNPKERGSYLTLAFDHGLPGCPSYRILNYGTSRKWDNGRDKSKPPESRVKFWKLLLPPQALHAEDAKQ